MAWLEELAEANTPSFFIIDQEGSNQIICAQRIQPELWELQICQPDEYFLTWEDPLGYLQGCLASKSQEIVLRQQFDVKELVRGFYESLLAFAESTEYHPREWENKSIWDCFHERRPNYDRPRLIRELSQLTREEFLTAIQKAAPDFYKQETNNGERSDAIVFFDYDQWEEVVKLEFIEETLNENVYPFHGCNLRKLKSKIVERFIYWNRS